MTFSVVFVTTEEIFGGGEKNLFLLATELKKKGINTLIIAPKLICKLGNKRHLDMYELKVLKKYWFYNKDLIRNTKYIKKLTKILDKFDYVHAYNSNALTLIKFSKAKKIYTCHGPWEITNQKKAKKILEYVDKIITVSKVVQKYLFRIGLNAEIIPLGYKPKSKIKDIDHKISKSFISKKKINILCLARFQPIKGQLNLVFSLILLLTRRTDLRNKINIVFAGKAYNNKDYIYYLGTRMISHFLRLLGGEVNFLGFVSNTSKLFFETDFVVIPSRYESFSMVCLESLYFGKPVIYPTYTACEEIANKQIYGQSFKNGSIKSLSATIEKIICDNLFGSPKQLMKRAMKYNISNQASKMIIFYKNIK